MVLRHFRAAFVAALIGIFASTSVQASSPFTTIELPDISHGAATLTIVSPDGAETSLDLDAIERLPTYRVETTTPWRDSPAVFDGVLLTDILALGDLGDVASIRVAAENDYHSEFPDQVWKRLPILVATRVNGAPISRRERGPILFVIDAETYTRSALAREAYLVWMASRIEANE